MNTHPIVVPEHVTAALQRDEVALLDTDAGEWFGVAGDQRRTLGIYEHPAARKLALQCFEERRYFGEVCS
jgi:hypothetical protein